MKDICLAAGISKQAYYQHQWCVPEMFEEEALILNKVNAIRRRNPDMGARKLYNRIQPLSLGRDRFEQLLFSHGYRVCPAKNYTKTTKRHDRYRDYPNLCAGLTIQGVNQVWVSDITYFPFEGGFLYLIFEEDLYSRIILGNAVSDTLEASANLVALKRAFRFRGIPTYHFMLIHHSDPGSQYLSNKVLEYLKKRECLVSTSRNVYENAHIERLNGIVKNEYLRHFGIKNLEHLRRSVPDIAWSYNNERPHWSLGLRTPVEFEKYIKDLPPEERPVLKLYSEALEKDHA